MNTRSLSLAAIAGFAALASLATRGDAHHAFAAEFDATKPVAVQGVVTQARFVNPHSWIYLDVKDKDGSVTNWGFEFGTPSSLKTSGLERTDLKAGTPVSVSGFRAKNGGPFGYATNLTLPGNRKIRTGGAPDAPTAPAAR